LAGSRRRVGLLVSLALALALASRSDQD